MIPSPEVQSKIALWRQRAIDGTLTKEEMAEAVVLLRQDRRGAAVASEKAVSARKKAAAPRVVPSADDLLNDLMGGL